MALRNLLFKDLGLKLFSLVVAVLIWLTVSFAIRRELGDTHGALSPQQNRTFRQVPVRVVSGAGDVRWVKVDPKEIEVTVRGHPEVITNLQPTDLRVFVDLTDAEASPARYWRLHVATPLGVTPTRVVPQAVAITAPLKP